MRAVSRSKVRPLIAVCSAFAMFIGQSVWAEGKAAVAEAVSVDLVQYKVIEPEDGKERLIEAKEVRPGDVLEYVVTYSNNSAGVVRDLKALLPVSEGLEYVAKSAVPPAVEVATKEGVRGGKFAKEPLMRSVTGTDGVAHLEPVPVSDYSALRWNAPELQPGKSFTVRARMTLPKAVAADSSGR